ncbi:MAG: transporter substrate-binding domain-containing protein [Rhodothermales bacterium]|nr:transporter substrate-binding domain-containing protein [Rhodothermales bacterium]
MRKLVPLIVGVAVLAVGYLFVRMAPESSARPVRPIKLATGSWSPFVGPELDQDGPLARIVTEAIQRMGYEPELSFSSWDLTLGKVRRGEVMGAFPFIYSADRAEAFAFSDTLLTFEYVLFYNRARVPDPAALRPVDFEAGDYRFGKVEGYEAWPALEEAVPAFALYPTSTEAFRDLAKGEIDFLPEGRLPGLDVLHGPDVAADVEAVGYLDAADNPLFGAREGLHLILPKTRAARAFLDGFDAALAELDGSVLYREAVAEIRGEAVPADLVALQPVAGAAYTRVFRERGDPATSFFVPAGTRAAVLAWPASFSEAGGAAATEEPWCRVKLLNGPERGRVVFVDPRSVVLMP